MNREERNQWVGTLQIGDYVAYRTGSYQRNWAIAKIIRITPSGRINLNNGITINTDGSIRGDKYFYIQPVTEEIRTEIWRNKSIHSLRGNLKIEKLTNEQLKILLEML